MQLYAITDRLALSCDDSQQYEELVKMTAAWAQAGVNYIQVREKDLSPAELGELVRRVVEAGDRDVASTKVLVNGAASSGTMAAAKIALGAGADGVHHVGGFTRQSIGSSIAEVRRCFGPQEAIVSVACHSLADVEGAAEGGADLVLFAPVFGKELGASVLPGVGLQTLRAACTHAGGIPVFALGGVTAQNARDCIDAGAAGVAGITLFRGPAWHTLS